MSVAFFYLSLLYFLKSSQNRHFFLTLYLYLKIVNSCRNVGRICQSGRRTFQCRSRRCSRSQRSSKRSCSRSNRCKRICRSTTSTSRRRRSLCHCQCRSQCRRCQWSGLASRSSHRLGQCCCRSRSSSSCRRRISRSSRRKSTRSR